MKSLKSDIHGSHATTMLVRLSFSGNMKIELKTPLKTKDVSPVSVYFNGEEIECSLLNYISKYTNHVSWNHIFQHYRHAL